MALSRRTKKVLKAYAGWKSVKVAARFGVLPAVGAAIFQILRARREAKGDPVR